MILKRELSALAVWALVALPAFGYDDPGPWIPQDIDDCVKAEAKSADVRLEVLTAENPFYLRGDFDGDRKPDYVVLVMNPDQRKSGVVFCLASGK